MKYKLVLTSMVMGAIVCSTSAIVGAANVASQVSDTAKHEAVQSNWMDRTDIAVGVQTGGQSKLDKGHFLTDDQNSIYNKQSDYGNLTKAYIETLQPISHYDENSKSVLFVQGRIGRGGEKIASKEMRGYFLPELIINRNGQPSYTIKNTDEKSSETLGIIGTVGIGYRRLSRNEHAYVGVNAFVDRAFTGNYNRISGGVEYVNGLNEVYANVYKGLGNTGVVRGFGGNPYPKRLYPNGYPSTFPYNTIPSENYNTYKGGRALGGYEIGFARSFKNARWARAYVNGYRWKGHGFGHSQEYNYYEIESDLEIGKLVVRSRKAGDTILGKNSEHQKIKKILIDEKIPKWERDKIPIIENINDVEDGDKREILLVSNIKSSKFLKKVEFNMLGKEKRILIIGRKDGR